MCQNCNAVKAFWTDLQWKPMHELEIKRREVLENDIEMEVLYCGICHSDLHQVKNDWWFTTYPIVPGHEIVWRITKIWSKTTNFKVWDLAGIGCIVDSCGECEYCKAWLEQYCVKWVTFSFASLDKHTWLMTYGWFSKSYVCDEKYVLKMPEFNDLAAAAPLLCAWITVYSPLMHWKTGPWKKVWVLWVWGLWHLAIKIAKAMWAEVTILTTSESKIEDAKRLWAVNAVLTKDAEQMQKAIWSLDLIIDTVSAKHDINTYLSLLKPEGSLVLVWLPAEPLEVSSFNIVTWRKSFSGSNIGWIKETQEMLDFCFKHDIVADIELIDVNYSNEAFKRIESWDVKYRFVIDLDTLK